MVQNASNKPGKNIFIICPLKERDSPTRERSDRVRDEIIVPIAKEMGYKPIRSDTISKPGSITYEIIEHLYNDEIVVADITDHNANVFYELAVRHMKNKPVILIGEGEGMPPFDLKDQRVISYNLEKPEVIENSKKELKAQIEVVESEKFIIDSPIKVYSLVLVSLSKDKLMKLYEEKKELIYKRDEIINQNLRILARERKEHERNEAERLIHRELGNILTYIDSVISIITKTSDREHLERFKGLVVKYHAIQTKEELLKYAKEIATLAAQAINITIKISESEIELASKPINFENFSIY